MEERITEVLKDGIWVKTLIKNLKVGDIIRGRDVDEDGNLHPQAIEDGSRHYKILENPFLDEDMIWRAMVEYINPSKED